MRNMKKMKWLAGIVLSVITVFTSVGAIRAEEGTVTEKLPISMSFENEVGEKKVADEDAKVINEAFGYGSGSNTVMVCSEDTWMYIDWEKSMYTADNVIYTRIFTPVLYRDENDNLIVEKDKDGKIKRTLYDYTGWAGIKDDGHISMAAGGEGSFF